MRPQSFWTSHIWPQPFYEPYSASVLLDEPHTASALLRAIFGLSPSGRATYGLSPSTSQIRPQSWTSHIRPQPSTSHIRPQSFWVMVTVAVSRPYNLRPPTSMHPRREALQQPFHFPAMVRYTLHHTASELDASGLKGLRSP